jgi:hypothetical protein
LLSFSETLDEGKPTLTSLEVRIVREVDRATYGLERLLLVLVLGLALISALRSIERLSADSSV